MGEVGYIRRRNAVIVGINRLRNFGGVVSRFVGIDIFLWG